MIDCLIFFKSVCHGGYVILKEVDMKSIKGFTLMELMIVIAIIVILTGIMLARVGTGGAKARDAKARAEMAEFSGALKAFNTDTGYWIRKDTWTQTDTGLLSKAVITEVINEAGGTVTTEAVLTAVKDNWKGPYVEAFELPKDPWGANCYRIYLRASVPKALYVWCSGPDGVGVAGNIDWTLGKVTAGDDILLLVHRF